MEHNRTQQSWQEVLLFFLNYFALTDAAHVSTIAYLSNWDSEMQVIMLRMTIFDGKISSQKRKGTLTEWKQPYKETEQIK